MTDVLVRNVSKDDLARLDRVAERVGLSRAEYLRRLIAEQVEAPAKDLTVGDLHQFTQATIDLDNPDVMRGAWR
ncbi:MAG: ribbon-helix-helix protein, CopG family [Bifidobacteriaceae bacterium]|jgi:hypothetical protein|nr:ribbon-helix-helix protein, CopG family [Bifidobacteriaceae bacterium]